MPGSFYTPSGAAANLIGGMLFLLLLGFYLCLIITTGVVLLSKRARISMPVIAVVALFIITMITAVTTVVSLYQAYVTSPDGATVYWAMLATWQIDKPVGTIDNLCFTLSTIIADTVLLWRMYIVWDRNRYTLIFPIISYVICFPGSFAVCGLGIAIDLHGLEPGYITPYRILALLSLSNAIVLCCYNTGMVCGRLWYMRRQIMRYNDQPNPYGRIILALVESGAAYSVCMLIFIIFYAESAGYGATIMINICSVMVAICPTLVVLRLSLGHPQSSDAKDTLGNGHFRRPTAANADRQGASHSVQVRAGQTSTVMTGASITFAPRRQQGLSFIDSALEEVEETRTESSRGDIYSSSNKPDSLAAQGDVKDVEAGVMQLPDAAQSNPEMMV